MLFLLLALSWLRLPDFSECTDTAHLFRALFLPATQDVQASLVVGKILLEICVELQQQGHVAVAYFAFRERGRRSYGGIKPGRMATNVADLIAC
jgi:hypothetical protein